MRFRLIDAAKEEFPIHRICDVLGVSAHLSRSVLVFQAVGFQRIEARALVNTFDGLSAGVLLIDRDGQLVHVNASGARHAL